MPLESCQKYTATLSEILALAPVVQTIADATDVPGVRLEWLNGAWYGDCGFPSAAQHSALLAANAYNSLGLGARATVNGSPVTWKGAAGWVADWDADALLVIGDSRTAYEGAYATDGTLREINYSHAGPVNWMQQMLGDLRFKRLHLRGRSGIRAYDVATSAVQGWDIASILASSDAKHVLVRLGTNDLGLSSLYTADQIVDFLAAIVLAITTSGRIAHVATVEPRDLIDGYTASDTIRCVALNQLIMYRFASGQNTYCVDVTKQLVDYAQAAKCTPIIAASTSVVHDGLHQSIRGAYLIGLALKNHFSQFRNNSFRFGSIHFLNTKANSSTKRKQLVSGPLMNSGINTIAKTGLTFTTVAAPNGVGSALRVDSDATSIQSLPTNGFAYQDININAGDIASGVTMYGYARFRISGAGGTGTPTGLKGIGIAAQIDRNGGTGFAQGARCNFTDQDSSGGYATTSVCEFAGELLLVTPRYTFTGSETLSLPYLLFYNKSLAGAQYRVEVYDCGVILENPGNPDRFAQFWTDTTPPVPVY